MQEVFNIYTMRAVNSLPEGYKEIYSIDLQKDRKMSLLVNLTAVIISAILLVPMHFRIPISTLFDMQAGLGNYSIRFLALIVLMIVYMVLHELVHGIAMKMCGTQKIKYGFTG